MAEPVAQKELAEVRRTLGRQLADLREAAGLTQAQLATLTGYTRSSVANIETGRSSQPRTSWTRYDQLLDAGGVLVAGYDRYAALADRHRKQASKERERQRAARIEQWRHNLPTRYPAEPSSADANAADAAGGRGGAAWLTDGVRRRSALALPALSATVMATGVAEPWNRLAYALAYPDRLEGNTVEHLQVRTREFFYWEEHTPSRQLAADLRAHIAQMTKLAADGPTRFHRALMTSLGEALALAAWLAWDSGEATLVERTYKEADTAAREAGDGPLLACTLAYRSYLAEAAGDLPAAQELLGCAQGYTRSEHNAGSRSWLAAREAEVAAALSNRTVALLALERALTAYDYAHPYYERSWTGFFTPSRLGSMAVATCARLDHPELGTTTEAVIRSLPSTEVKTRAIILADVATAAIQRGDHDHGAELGHRALDQAIAQEVSVARQHLRHLHTTIGQVPPASALADLDQRLVAHVM